jgi:hypothetical protein
MSKLPTLINSSHSLKVFISPLDPYPLWVPYYHWRNAQILAAIFNAAGLLVATFDYEHRYSGNRNHYNCEEGDIDDNFRWYIFGFTCLATLFTLLRYYLKLQWFKKKQRKYYKQKFTYEFYISFRKSAIIQACLEVGYLWIFPYPGLKSSSNFGTVEYLVTIENSDTSGAKYHLCYTTAELLYSMMFFRVILIIRAILLGTVFQDDLSNYVCNQFRENADFSYTVRCYLRCTPFLSSIVAIVPSVFILGALLRIFERPFIEISGANFESYFTGVWCAAVTMTTIGYGDVMPRTHLGKMIVLLSAFWGLFMFSILVSSLDSVTQLNSAQNSAFVRSQEVRASGYLVRAALQYSYAKKHYGATHPKTLALYKYMLKETAKFRANYVKKENDSPQNVMLANLTSSIAELAKQLGKVEDKLAIFDQISGVMIR